VGAGDVVLGVGGADARPDDARAPNRRRAERLAVRCGCWLESDDATVFGRTVDLAEGGLLLRTALSLPLGTAVDVRLQLPGHATPVLARGRVARTEASARRVGVAVQLEQVRSGAEQLARFLAARGGRGAGGGDQMIARSARSTLAT
jgi:uncharacterized protein (TIGR02266 family)